MKKIISLVMALLIVLSSISCMGTFIASAINAAPVAGDINGDGTANNKDLTRLMKYLAGDDVEVVDVAIDPNGDGTTNNKDLTRLMRYLAGDDVEIAVGCDHEIETVDEKEATCLEEGNIAYWYCGLCNTCFSDEEGVNEIALEETVVESSGHKEVIDPEVEATYETTGLTQGSHCSVCLEVIIEQVIIPVKQPEYYSITYVDTKNQTSKTVKYKQNEEVFTSKTDIEVTSVTGYNYSVWYTKDGEYVDYIPAGNTEDYILYVKWDPIKYSITYKDAPVNDNNPDSYTIEDSIVLSDPSWFGLSFSHWTDNDGNTISRVDKGTTGNLEFTANWISKKNMVVPSNQDDPELMVIYNDKMEQYHFISELGIIEHVVIGVLNTDYKQENEELSWKISKTVSIEEDNATSVAKTVAESVANSSEMTETVERVKSESLTVNTEMSAALEVEAYGIKSKIEASLGTAETDEDSWSTSKAKTSHTSIGSEESNTISSTVSYRNDISTTIEKEINISKEMPEGYYSYVYTGTLRVYAIVTYDPAEGNYYIDTYSIMDDQIAEMRLYTPPENSTVNIVSNQTMAYKVPFERLLEYIDSSYYIQYDANGGEGEMPMSVIGVGKNQTLLPNSFKKNGYTFAGWELMKGDSIDVYSDQESVCDIAAGGETITLRALWANNKYIVKFDTNTPRDFLIPELSGGNQTTVTFGNSYKFGVPVCEYYKFDGWYTEKTGGKKLTDGSGNSLEGWSFDSDKILYAHWVNVSGYEYISNREDLEKINNDPSLNYMLINDIDLSGFSWTPLGRFSGKFEGDGHKISNMTINSSVSNMGLFSALDGATVSNVKLVNVNINNSSTTSAYTGALAGTANNSTITNCYSSGNIITGVTALDTFTTPKNNFQTGQICGALNNVTLNKCSSDVYIKNTVYVCDEDKKITDSGRWGNHKDEVYLKDMLGVDKAWLQDQGIETIKITATIMSQDIDDGNHYIFLYNGNVTSGKGNELFKSKFTDPDNGDWTSHSFEWVLKVSDIPDNNYLKVLYGADGDYNDDWRIGDLWLTVEYI